MFIADLHIHSYLSRATSKTLNLEHLNLWSQLKGIRVLGTGDFTHPQWFSELKEKLREAEPGLFQLRPQCLAAAEEQVPHRCRASVRFMLSVEISCIYKKNGRVRKNHHVVFVPGFESADRFNRVLDRIGNIRSDGRPILGLDARDLLEIVLELSPDAHLIPAHIWTPWFSLFGSKSGFDSMDECFGDLSGHIFAVETGLSSDPPMNWRLSSLDGMALVSNSDAHSPPNLGREANIFDTDLSYFSIFEALKSKNSGGFLGTIEFFPEEGKYHFDGHRKCEMRMSPKETLERDGLCPKCGRPVTVGVMHRVQDLADRDESVQPEGAAPFRSLLTLPDILAQARGVSPQTKGVDIQYRRLLEKYGPEFSVLMDLPLEALEGSGDDILAEGLRRMRQGEVQIRAGYDGEFGSIVLFTPEERRMLSRQGSLIPLGSDSPRPGMSEQKSSLARKTRGQVNKTESINDSSASLSPKGDVAVCTTENDPLLPGLNAQQRKAVCHWKTPLLVVAGPGTGKTQTLTRRIAYLIRQGVTRPEQILAITFTNRAAEEMRERLASLLGGETRITVQTFHALGYEILRDQRGFRGQPSTIRILDEVESAGLLKGVLSKLGSLRSRKERSGLHEAISKAKQDLYRPEAFEASDPDLAMAYQSYQTALERAEAFDLDDLIVLPVRLFEENPDVLRHYRERFPFLSVDEYQDVNYAQYRLVQLLSPQGENLCAIGDPDQAIYGFRGADSRYFLKFRDDYPGAEIVCLEQSFRSSEAILRASARLISRNPHHRVKPLWSRISGDDFLSVAEYTTDKAEAEAVVRTIDQLMGGTSHFSFDSGRVDAIQGPEAKSFSDFAVFYRLHFQGELLEQAFDRAGIPYRRIGGEPLARHGHVRQVLEALRKDSERRNTQDSQRDNPMVLTTGGEDRNALGELMRKIIETSGFDPDEEALKSLVRQADAWGGDTVEFLAQMALRSDLDAVDPRAEKVTLMTLHASKGLEFPVVFVVGCEADVLPYKPDGRDPSPVEEERRLLFVGLTRAKEKIFLTHVRKRNMFGRIRLQEPSPFLKEIEDHLRQTTERVRRTSAERRGGQLNLF